MASKERGIRGSFAIFFTVVVTVLSSLPSSADGCLGFIKAYAAFPK